MHTHTCADRDDTQVVGMEERRKDLNDVGRLTGHEMEERNKANDEEEVIGEARSSDGTCG